jgi:hypothetical protein
VPLSAAIAALRDELARAWWDAKNQSIRFKPSPIELTLQVAVTGRGTGRAGVRWWLLELGGEVSHESVVTQTVKVSLEPQIFDENGQPLEFLIEAVDQEAPADSAEITLDAPG